ncbi:hypothetical protein [Clostridium thailandense]|uniref:hypothetical protein n=1 Tax=Clostridium thailandense TaxID=2794346 RepID=UPI00398985C4
MLKEVKHITKQEKLFNYYYKLQSDEFRKGIKGYKNLNMKNTLCAIKVIFKNDDWIRVYQRLTGEVEWY